MEGGNGGKEGKGEKNFREEEEKKKIGNEVERKKIFL